jgi:hypothetical protein
VPELPATLGVIKCAEAVMGFEPIVHCLNCGDCLDVYAPKEERFCSDDCKENYWAIKKAFAETGANDNPDMAK